ncbi:hypothetical protein ACIRRH_39695 [Kitasatospora sp. NPDC101235]|uniref:hypothetical protein n=1 Tax=Kitasatospora sp. NPDC101235 TaxID=3364101 RepID=UPI003827352D
MGNYSTVHTVTDPAPVPEPPAHTPPAEPGRRRLADPRRPVAPARRRAAPGGGEEGAAALRHFAGDAPVLDDDQGVAAAR